MAIDLKVDDAIALITLNRPDRLNALDAEHYDALAAAWATADVGRRAGRHRRFLEKRTPRFTGN